MKNVQSHNPAFTHHRRACGFAIAVWLVSMMTNTIFSQSNMFAPAPPMTMPGYAGYDYTTAPMVGPYYSGNSPMLQPQVQGQTIQQLTPMQMQVLQAMQANSLGYPSGNYNAGMMPPNMAGVYGSPYDMSNNATMQQMYGQQTYYDQNEPPISEYEAASQTIGQAHTTSSAYNPYTPLRSPLLETGWETAKLLSPFNAPTGPHRGVGTPLKDQSWLNRPYYFGVFGGYVSGGELISGQVDQKSGNNGGVSLGWNLNHYWGVEGRIFGSSVDTKDISGSANPAPGGSNRLTVLDASVHYYPYGEARWRPYFKFGIGFAEERFTDNFGNTQKANTWTVPAGAGIKYWWSDRVNVYGEVVDNVIFGKGPTKTHGNIALNFGVNFTFGTNPIHHPTVYWP